MSNISVEVTDVVKSYGRISALRGVSFRAEKGELFGFIGPDGAGKTSLFRILATLLLPGQGQATVEGLDVVRDFKKVRRIVGYMPGRFSLYQDLSVEENLTFFATIFGTSIRENYDLIRDIYSQIEPFKDRPAGKLSGGMKQKLALSCALIHKPRVLFLDEPTTGVDAVSRKEFWEMLRKLKESGITILVSTPYMDEAGLCDRVALIQAGKILQIDQPAGIVSGYSKSLLAVRSDSMFTLIRDLRKHNPENTAYLFGEFVHYSCDPAEDQMNALSVYLRSCGHSGIEIRQIVPTIEDCFMALIENMEGNS